MPEWKVPGYTELKALGSGGFGDVVLARHGATGTLVAIKYLRRDLLADAEFAELFRAEATVLASLDDPNVVRLYEYVESPAGAAIVMELIGGVTLREILTFQGKTTAEAALVVLQGSLLGLAAAHRRGVVHRDYKPENVLVNGDGLSKLTDFGIAARAGDHPVPAGTLLYAAPEQMAGAPASPASDVYAATATFYECLTGRPPFRGEADDLLRQHRSAPVPLEPVPEPLRPLVAAGMAKDPRGRPTDATTFVTELNAVASGAYGRDWPERGRSHMGEAALLLAALWPSGPPPAVQGTAVHQVPLGKRAAPRRSTPHGSTPRRRIRPRHFGAARVAVIAGAAIFAVAAGTALASTVANQPGPPKHPVAAVQPVSLQPSPTLITPPTSPSSSSSSASQSSSPPPVLTTSPPPVLTTSPPPVLTTSPPPVLTTSPPPPVLTTSPPPVQMTTPPPPCTPKIATVGAFEANATQTVQISGSCFGAGNTTSAADTAYFRVSDLTAGWNACWTGDPGTDLVTCDISSWTDQEITFSGYTGEYGQSNYVVAAGDNIEIQVWNPQSGQGPAICQIVAGSGVPAHCSGS
jgi:eukaryotic-like serine/threonine-protein kinase